MECLSQILARSVRLVPDRPFIIADRQSLTYAEFGAGTAQLASNKFLKGTEAGKAMRDNAWFVGFAPRQSPEIVVVALFESGEHGDRAAPIVRDVIKSYFDKKARKQEPPRPQLAMK